jgi:hypothetical protein
MKQPDEDIKELARRLCAATISCEMGMSLQHAYKEWVKSQESEIGAYWIALAEQVSARHSEGSMKDINETVANKVDAVSAELFAEFKRHVKEVQREQPGMTDKSIIFEGWIVQRVAGLQALVIELSERIALLQGKR